MSAARERLLESVREIVHSEVAPLSAAQKQHAYHLQTIDGRLDKIEVAINGNGREGIREELAGMKRVCKRNHGSGPPPRAEQESIHEILLEREKTRRIPWRVIGIVLVALIGAVGTVYASAYAAAAQARAAQQR